jgi:hypothetical protein
VPTGTAKIKFAAVSNAAWRSINRTPKELYHKFIKPVIVASSKVIAKKNLKS